MNTNKKSIRTFRANTTFISVLIFLGIFTLTGNSLAAPSITGVTGTISNGQSITINGSSFGAGDAEPLLWDDFESGTNGSILDASPKVGSWVRMENPDMATYSTAAAHSGTKSSGAYHSGTTNGDDASQIKVESLPHEQYFYQYFWCRTNDWGSITKLSQWHGDENCHTGGYDPGIYIGSIWDGWVTGIDEGNNEGVTQDVDWLGMWQPRVDPSLNAWHLVEVQAKQASGNNVADGALKVWFDGVLMSDQQNMVTKTEGSGCYWYLASFFYCPMYSSGTVTWYVDDAYLNNSWTRVIIGNASTLANSTHREIQIPSIWNDASSPNSIHVTVNQGSFTTGNAWLYVVDSNGVVSDYNQSNEIPEEGYPITFGTSPSGDTTPPATPSGLSVQ